METLRFLMVTTHYPPNHMGGDAVFVKYLAEELVQRGHEVHVLSNPSAYEVFRGRRATLDQDKTNLDSTQHYHLTKHKHLGLGIGLVLGSTGGARGKFLETSKNVKPDVVHWHNTKGFIGRPMSSTDAVQFCTAHDYFLICPRSNLLKPGSSLCVNLTHCLACQLQWRRPPQLWRFGSHRTIHVPSDMNIIAPSDYLSRRLQSGGLDVTRTIRNFVPNLSTQATKHQPDDPTLAYVGLMERHKGPHTLLDAFVATAEHHEFNMIMIGEGSLRETLVDRVRMAGLDRRVRIPGFLPSDELASAVSNASALMVPSEWPENCPLVVLEAFSKGVPVIASDQGGLPELTVASRGSMTFRSADRDDLGARIIELWNMRDKLKSLGTLARRAYEEDFSPPVHLRQYFELINDTEKHSD